jgi:thymidylate kinase
MNSVLIAFEGLPGGGKTTLVKMLAQELDGEYIPEIVETDKYSPDQDEYYIESEFQKIDFAKKSTKKYKILDRSYISMLAYNYGKKENGLENIYNVLVEKFKDMPEPNLYVYLKIDEIGVCNARKGIEGRNPVWVNEHNLLKIRDYYEKKLKGKKNCLVVCVDQYSLDEAYKLIINHIKESYGR